MLTLKLAFLGAFFVPLAASADPILILANYGALGIMLILILTGFVRTKSEVDNRDKQLETKDRQIADQQRMIDAFTANLTGLTIPAMARSTQVLEHIPRGEAAVIEKLERLAELLEGKLPNGDNPNG